MQMIASHTALRGLAALAVVYGHYTAVFLHGPGVFDAYVPHTHIGVDLFFMLSGFILYRLYAPAFADGVSVRDWAAFQLRRLARIYPLHLVTLGAVLVLLRFDIAPEDRGILVMNVALIHGWGLTDRFLFNSPSWSISCEFAAYLVFPFLAWLAVRNRALLLVPVVLGYGLLWARGGGSLDLDETGRTLSLLRVVAGFPLGMLLAGVRGVPDGAVAQALAVAAPVLSLALGLPEIVTVLLMAGLIVVTARDAGVLGRGLAWPPLTWLGDMSFSLYLIQWPMMLAMFNLRPWMARLWQGPALEVAALMVFLALLVGGALLTRRFVERPVQDWARPRTRLGNRAA